MIDTNTKSLWSHLYGRAMRGPLQGAELKRLPSTMTDWGTWRRLNPKTTVVLLSRTTRVYDRGFYRNLADFVIGVTNRQSAKAWPFDVLIHEPVVNDHFSQITQCSSPFKPTARRRRRSVVSSMVAHSTLKTGMAS